MNSLVAFLSNVNGKSFKKQDKELNAIWKVESATTTKEEFTLKLFNSMLQVGGDDFANYFSKYGGILTRFGIDDEVGLIKNLENTCITNPNRFVHLLSVLECEDALRPGEVKNWSDLRVGQMERDALSMEKVELLKAYISAAKARKALD